MIETAISKYYDKWMYEEPAVVFEDDVLKEAFRAGWLARDVHEKDQLAKSLAEFDNDNNDCGSGGCIL